MFSSQGLADWELVVVSGTLALGMLIISALIGSIVAYVALREPELVAKTITAREEKGRNQARSPRETSIAQPA